MYRILLVDDEWLELDTLEKYMPWEEMGFTVAGTASNGKEAPRLLSQWEASSGSGIRSQNSLMPQIVLTDVKMPVMDGIALSREIRSRYPDIQIIFLSGYNDFEYVRTALEVEACDYILKPVTSEDLSKAMAKARSKCSRNSRRHQTQAALTAEHIRQLLGLSSSGQSTDWEEIGAACSQILHLPEGNSQFYTGMIFIDEYRFLSGYEDNGKAIIRELEREISVFSQKNRFLLFHINDSSRLLLSGRSLLECTRYFLESGDEGEGKNASRWVSACLYQSPQNLELLPSLCEEMERFHKLHVQMYGSGHVIVCDMTDSDKKQPIQPQLPDYTALLSLLQNGKYEETEKWLKEYFPEKTGTGDFLTRRAFELADRIYSCVIATNPNIRQHFEAQRADLFGKLTTVQSPELIRSVLARFFFEVSDALVSLKGDHHLEIVERLQEIISRDYARPLTIESLAEQVYMSPNYLRTLFKDYTGETVLEYITRTRIEASVRLLRDTNLRIHEISSRVGYENPSHYCAVFRRQIGITPNQYRNKIAKEKKQ